MGEVKHTPGPWEYVAGTEHHGPYVSSYCGDVADCYTMSNPLAASIRNGGDSYPVVFQGEQAEANARVIAAAPEMLEALKGFNLKEEWIVGGSADALTLRVPITVIQAAAAAVAKAEGRP